MNLLNCHSINSCEISPWNSKKELHLIPNIYLTFKNSEARCLSFVYFTYMGTFVRWVNIHCHKWKPNGI
jgi:hypothetical protein